MTKPLILKKSASADIQSTYRWYKARTPQLGIRFLEEVQQGLEEIQSHPEQYRIFRGAGRRRNLRAFPYFLFYVVKEEHIEVAACVHEARDPSLLDRRLEK